MGRRGRPKHPDVLTPREWEVLGLLREGLTNEQIAERLAVSFATARYHVSEILSKLGVGSREEAARWEPEGRREWWRWAWPLTLAKAAGVALAAAAVVGLGVLAWTVLRSDSEPAIAGTVPLTRGVYSVGFDGGEPKRIVDAPLVDDPYGNGAIVTSPDGEWFAFRNHYWSTSKWDVYSVYGDEGVAIEAEGRIEVIALAPGGRLALVEVIDAPYGRYLWDADDGSFTPFLEGLSIYDAEWSPDGEQIAFTAYGDYEVERVAYVATLDGTMTKVVDNARRVGWSADGSWLAVVTDVPESTVLRWDRETGLTELARYDGEYDARSVRVSANGTIVFDAGDYRPQKWFVAPGDDVARVVGYGRDPSWSPSGDELVYVDRGVPYWMDLATGDSVALAGEEEEFAIDPLWLPDGSGVLFAHAPPYGTSVFVIDVESGDEREVAFGEGPDWSPDGKKLAYLGALPAGTIVLSRQIFTVDVDGESEPTRVSGYTVTDEPVACGLHSGDLQWSQNGKWVAHTSGSSGQVIAAPVVPDVDEFRAFGCEYAWSPDGGRIATLIADGIDRFIQITALETGTSETLGEGANVAWSPDGRQIVFSRGTDVVVRDLATGEERVLVERLGRMEQGFSLVDLDRVATVRPIIWSPRGDLIAVTMVPFGESEEEIVLLDAATGEVRDAGEGSNPAWSPDGERLAFSRRSLRAGSMLYVVGVDGGEPELLTAGDEPDWSPDGKRIAFTK